MTETSDQSSPVPPPAPPPLQPAGMNHEHLRDYTALRRSRVERKVAGVAGGLAQHLNIDPTILRVLFVVLSFFGGAGLLLYAAGWLLVPEEGSERTVISVSDSWRNALLIGAIVIAGLIVLSDGWWGRGFPWVLAIGLILGVVIASREKRHTPPPPHGPPPAPGAPMPAAYDQTAVLDLPPSPPPPPGFGPPPVWYPPVPPTPRRPKRNGPILFGLTLALVALGLGLLGLYDASGGDPSDGAYPALTLAIVGVMLVVGSFFGRPGGLIALGLLAAAATVVAGVGEPTYQGERDQLYQPTSAAEVRDSYYVPAGRIELDLTGITEGQGLDGREVDLSGNVGEIVVRVPENVQVAVDAEIDFGGQIDIGATSREGWGPELTRTLPTTDPVATMNLELNLHAGHLQVVRGTEG